MITYLLCISALVRTRLRQIRDDEHGYSTETVLVTALLVAGAIAVLAIIVSAVTRKAHEIQGHLS